MIPKATENGNCAENNKTRKMRIKVTEVDCTRILIEHTS